MLTVSVVQRGVPCPLDYFPRRLARSMVGLLFDVANRSPYHGDENTDSDLSCET